MHGICLGETDPSAHRGDNHMCHISVYVQGCVPQGRPMCKKHRAQLHPELQSIIPTKNFQWDLKGIGAAAVQKWCIAVWIQCGGYVEHSGRQFASSHTSNVPCQLGYPAGFFWMGVPISNGQKVVGGLHNSNTSWMYPALLTASHQRSKLRLVLSIYH
jgi:hypothetical protein